MIKSEPQLQMKFLLAAAVFGMFLFFLEQLFVKIKDQLSEHHAGCAEQDDLEGSGFVRQQKIYKKPSYNDRCGDQQYSS